MLILRWQKHAEMNAHVHGSRLAHRLPIGSQNNQVCLFPLCNIKDDLCYGAGWCIHGLSCQVCPVMHPLGVQDWNDSAQYKEPRLSQMLFASLVTSRQLAAGLYLHPRSFRHPGKACQLNLVEGLTIWPGRPSHGQCLHARGGFLLGPEMKMMCLAHLHMQYPPSDSNSRCS